MIKNQDLIRQLASPELGAFGSRILEALQGLDQQHQNLAQQVNGNSTGQPSAPPQIAGLTVKAQNGHFTASITDNAPIFRGIQYYIEHADNPHFINRMVVHLGDSRDWQGFMGNVTRYFRAYSSYSSSPSSPPAYHGGAGQPRAVTGGGTIGGPSFQDSQGSGTGGPGQGLQGPGQIPFRSANGAPPPRS